MWDPLCAEFNRKETQWRCSPEFSLLSEWETRSWNFILASPGIHVRNFEDMRAALIVPDCSFVCQQLCLLLLVCYDHRSCVRSTTGESREVSRRLQTHFKPC